MKYIFATILLFSLNSAQANEGVWTLDSQNSDEKCAQEVSFKEVENGVEVFQTANSQWTFSAQFYSINEGTQCYPLGSGNMLGGMRCSKATFENDVYSVTTCSTNFWNFTCEPNAKNVDHQTETLKVSDSSMNFTETSWDYWEKRIQVRRCNFVKL